MPAPDFIIPGREMSRGWRGLPYGLFLLPFRDPFVSPGEGGDIYGGSGGFLSGNRFNSRHLRREGSGNFGVSARVSWSINFWEEFGDASFFDAASDWHLDVIPKKIELNKILKIATTAVYSVFYSFVLHLLFSPLFWKYIFRFDNTNLQSSKGFFLNVSKAS